MGVAKERLPTATDRYATKFVQGSLIRSYPCLEAIRQYFGVKIALYFCWLRYVQILRGTPPYDWIRLVHSFYTKALCLPAAYGIYIWYHTGQSQVGSHSFTHARTPSSYFG